MIEINIEVVKNIYLAIKPTLREIEQGLMGKCAVDIATEIDRDIIDELLKNI